MTRESNDELKRWSSAAAWGVGIVVVFSCSYVASNVHVMHLQVNAEPTYTVRYYSSTTIAQVFIPAAWIEARIIRKPVIVASNNAGTDLFDCVSRP